MSLSPPSVEITVQDGGLSSGAQPPDDGVFWVFGMSSSGTANSPFTTSNATDLKSTFGYGDGVEAALYALNNEVGSVAFVRVDPTGATAGVYGSIAVTAQDAAAFTVTGDSTVKPADDWQPKIDFTVGATIGVSGAKYTYSLDNGGKVSGERDLGTDTFISLPFGGGKYHLDPPTDALVALANDIRTQALAHFPKTSGSVHGAGDTTSDDGIGSAATSNATALTLANTLRTGILAHFARGSSVHLTADTTSGADIPAAATTLQEARLLLVALKAALNAHEADETYHTAADTNLVTEDDPSAGVITAGDSFSLTNTAPRWDIDKLVEALQKGRDSNLSMNGVIEIVGNVLTNGEASAIEDAMADIASKYRDARAVGHYRMRNVGESLQAYAAAFAAAHPLASSSGRLGRLTLCASMYVPSQLVPGAIPARPMSFGAAPRLARTPFATNPINTAGFGTLKGALRAANGTDVLPRAVDEAYAGVCTPVRLWAPMSRPSGIQPSLAVTIAPDGSDFETIQNGRVVDAVRKSAYKLLDARLGQNVAAKPGTVVIDPNEKKRIEEQITKSLREVYAGKHCTDVYIVIDPTSVVSGVGTKLVKAAIYVVPFGTINAISATISLALA